MSARCSLADSRQPLPPYDFATGQLPLRVLCVLVSLTVHCYAPFVKGAATSGSLPAMLYARSDLEIIITWAILGLLISFLPIVSCRQLADVYWNASSATFLLANRYGPTLDVQIGDRLNILCPYYSTPTAATPRLDAYLEIYRVPKDGYEKCMLSEGSKIVGVCATPETVTPLTLVVREFTANPSGLEFKPGRRYYFITTSDGSREGMSNANGGLCRSNGMKMVMDVQNAANNLTSKPPNPAKTKEYFFITYQTPEFFEDDDDSDQTTQVDYDDSQNGEITTAVTGDYDTNEWMRTTAKGDTTDMWYVVHTRSPEEQQTLSYIDNQWNEESVTPLNSATRKKVFGTFQEEL
ncbi:Ephrin domain containing protein [Trichuris trichiura]|uniref:Ephrin domain containing protein n=1 Tax=Trichuris trichiura TaxID=36087 RepID=A0A077Z4P1_TRITR|nr:Ephrin domain containing protein [Trichuris trichiura]